MNHSAALNSTEAKKKYKKLSNKVLEEFNEFYQKVN